MPEVVSAQAIQPEQNDVSIPGLFRRGSTRRPEQRHHRATSRENTEIAHSPRTIPQTRQSWSGAWARTQDETAPWRYAPRVASARNAGTETRVVRAEKNQYLAVRDTLADAFAEDPILAWLLSHRGNTRKARQHLFGRGVRSSLRRGVVEITEDGSAAALWWPPGTASIGGVREVLEGLLELWGSWRALGSGLGRAGRFYEDMLRMRPAEPHWYLAAIGTRPETRQRGAGSALLAERLAACDAEHHPAYLECSNANNLAFYERHGFQAGEQCTLDGSPPFWPMSRAAR